MQVEIFSCYINYERGEHVERMQVMPQVGKSIITRVYGDSPRQVESKVIRYSLCLLASNVP